MSLVGYFRGVLFLNQNIFPKALIDIGNIFLFKNFGAPGFLSWPWWNLFVTV